MAISRKLHLVNSNYKKLSENNNGWKNRIIPPETRVAVDVDSLVFLCMRMDILNPKKCKRKILNMCKPFNSSYDLVYSYGIPKLKYKLYLERQNIDRDILRDKVVELLDGIRVLEADKYCGKNYRYILTEDVDIFLFGNSKTTLVSPITYMTMRCRDYYRYHGMMSHSMFLDIAIIMGTDYNYGISRVGVKKARDIITTYDTVGDYLVATYDMNLPENVLYIKEHLKVLKYFRE
jgi:hypothetical protein